MDVMGKQSSKKRLIDVDEARRRIIAFATGLHSVVLPVDTLMELLKQVPTVDAVPVVRCQECKHHRDKNEQEQQYLVEDILICTSPDATDDCRNAVWPDHFCSYGEQKEGADNI